MLVEMLAGLILLSVIAYALLGGADFGGGVWDLLARGPRAEEQREAIAKAMGPVWEANHVWLIFVIILVFTGFPEAFGMISIALFVPWHLVLLGIVLRGAAFVFRAYGPPARAAQRRWGRIFGVASLLTPLVLGMSLGAVSSGRVRVVDGAVSADAAAAWLAPTAWATGALAVGACAYLAATYLTLETTGALQEDFRRRALAAWAALAALSLLALPALRADASHLWEQFTRTEAWPVFVAGGLAAVGALAALVARRYVWARAAAAAQVAALLVGWAAILQYPYLIYPDVTLHEAAAASAVLQFTIWAVLGGMVILLPSLWLLFRVFKGSLPGVEQVDAAEE